jgi:uncharacterized membrane protein YidH (DUF202 family)
VSSQPDNAFHSHAASAHDGLQTERTVLAWNRTTLGIAANATLLAVHEVSNNSPVPWLPTGLAVGIALATATIGRRRARTLRTRPLPAQLAGGPALPLIGYTVAALAILTTALVIC